MKSGGWIIIAILAAAIGFWAGYDVASKQPKEIIKYKEVPAKAASAEKASAPASAGGYGEAAPAPASAGGYGEAAPAPASAGGYGSPAPASSGGYGSPAPASAGGDGK